MSGVASTGLSCRQRCKVLQHCWEGQSRGAALPSQGLLPCVDLHSAASPGTLNVWRCSICQKLVVAPLLCFFVERCLGNLCLWVARPPDCQLDVPQQDPQRQVKGSLKTWHLPGISPTATTQHCSLKAGLTRKTRLVHLSGMPYEADSAWHAFLIHPCNKSGWRTYDGVTFSQVPHICVTQTMALLC